MENEQQEGGTVRNSQAKSISGALLSPTYKWWSALCQSLSSVSYAPFNVKRPAMHSITSPKAVIGFSSKLGVWLPYCLTYTNNSYGMSQGCQRNMLEKRILQVSGICRIYSKVHPRGPCIFRWFFSWLQHQPVRHASVRRDSRLLKERWEPGFGYQIWVPNKKSPRKWMLHTVHTHSNGVYFSGFTWQKPKISACEDFGPCKTNRLLGSSKIFTQFPWSTPGVKNGLGNARKKTMVNFGEK